ncbi:MAG: glycosyltransferase [Nanoarchaeota archaeon]|nr:glycosyltransferase [Nanoarchaeota archaeon]
MKPKISIIVPVYNDEDNLMHCVSELRNQKVKEKFEIIVIEDGSKSDIKEKLKKFGNVRYFWKKNGGPASARNLAIKKAKGEFIAFIDSDCVADKEWLKFLYSELKSKKNNIGVIGKIKNYYDNTFSKALHTLEFNWWGGESYIEVEVAITCNSIFRKKDLEAVGLFGSFKYYGEDIDLGQKLVRKFDKKILYSPKPEIRHKTKGTLKNLVRKMNLSGKGFYLTRTRYPKMKFASLLKNKVLFSVALLFLPFVAAGRTFMNAIKSRSLSARKVVPVGFLILIGYFSFWFSVAKEVYTK